MVTTEPPPAASINGSAARAHATSEYALTSSAIQKRSRAGSPRRGRALSSLQTRRRGYPHRAMRVAVVTGASSGIGAALCRELRARGRHVVGLSRRPAPDADEHEECDVADRASVEAAATRVLERHPVLELLVNNAGIPARGGFLDTDPEV